VVTAMADFLITQAKTAPKKRKKYRWDALMNLS
jgi:hypothetical protein